METVFTWSFIRHKERQKTNSRRPRRRKQYIYIGAIDSNNGVANHIAQFPIHKGNTISLSYNGSVGEAFYQSEPYWATDDVNALYPKYERFNKYIGLFMVAVIRQEKYRFSYGRKWTLENMNATEICLPVQHNTDSSILIEPTYIYSDDGYLPDWGFMEKYIKSLKCKNLTTRNNFTKINLDINSWKEFSFGELISDIYKATAINKDDLLPTNSKCNGIRYITRTGDDNGCEMLADKDSFDNSIIEKGNAISIGDTTATCFYQEEDFIAGDHMVVIRADSWMNPYTALFVLAILNKEQYRYSYGRAFLIDRIKNTTVKLPVDNNGNPNWNFMKEYIKSLPYGDRLEG